MTIACALRWGVASVRRFSTGRGSPYKGKYFRCRTDTDERLSSEASIVKKANMWLLIFFFCKIFWNNLTCNFIIHESCS